MGAKKSKATSSTKSNLKNDATTTPLECKRIAQNYLLVWIDGNINEKDKDCQNTLKQLRAVVNDVNLFTQSDKCIQFLSNIVDEKVFLITSGSLGQNLVPDIHNLRQVEAIYIFCGNKSRHEEWAKKWMKIQGVHTNIQQICEALQMDTKQCNQDSIAVSFVGPSEGTSGENLNELDPSFMYTQVFKDILLDMTHDQKAIQDLVNYCRLDEEYSKEFHTINVFEETYEAKQAIWWYTRDCFTYEMLNRALRNLESDTIIKMGFFMSDLHQQILELHQQQIESYNGKSFLVYRGQGLSKTDFERLKNNINGLMSFNNFLSTSREETRSREFAKNAMGKSDMVGILFVMSIDPNVKKAPFASIEEISYFKEEKEILFSMHTVFRVRSVKPMVKDKELYRVELQLTDEDDQQLRILTERIRKETTGDTGWKRLVNLLLKLGHFKEAIELCKVLLDQTCDESDRASYYHKLGYAKNNQCEYIDAIEYYEKAIEIRRKILPSNHPLLATTYNNIGLVYNNMKEYSKALSYYEKVLEIQRKTLQSNDPDMATSYNNIGLVYNNLKEYSKALSYLDKALEIQQRSLSSNHPSLAISYSNIGSVYDNMGEYSKALSYHEKTLAIQQKTLPPKHLSLAISYNNMASLYYKMKDYSKALVYFERALSIFETSLPKDHPNIKTIQETIKILKQKLSISV